MNITKIGHCCLLIEIRGIRLLTDPGSFSRSQDELEDIDAVLITHEHADHLHMDSLKNILIRNLKALIITNETVGALLAEQGIAYQLVGHGESLQVAGITVEGFGTKHAVIYSSLPAMNNTGYFIDGRFFYPGDALTNPGKAVEILALPVAGPWLKLSEAIDYAKELHPTVCFPVHDAVLAPGILGLYHSLPARILQEEGINFMSLTEGQCAEFADRQ